MAHEERFAWSILSDYRETLKGIETDEFSSKCRGTRRGETVTASMMAEQ